MNYSELEKQFLSRYGESSQPIRTFFAPGRVNLIGDHTDYSGGWVFPCAIDYGAALLIRHAKDGKTKLASTSFNLAVTLAENEIDTRHGDDWINYPLAILHEFAAAGHPVSGFECLYSGNVPNAAGLSSSAAIEIVTAFAVNELLQAGFSMLDLVKLSQHAENEFIGVQCGIMDQFAVAMGQSGHAMRLDCKTLDCEQVPLSLGAHRIVLANSNQQRELSESKYNERVSETQQALAILKTVLNVTELAEVTPAQLEKHAGLFAEHAVIFQRARHVVTEHQRVIDAVSALRSGDLQQFGALMTQSHQSLKDDYAVSSGPLDALVELSLASNGVLGARLTGAGFGGCTVNIVHSEQTEAFISEVGQAYQQRTGLTADFYCVTPGDGVREVQV